MRKYAFLLLWSYFLGPWEIGPFTTWQGCENLRRYQIEMGATEIAMIGPCRVTKETYMVAPPTYGAPLTAEEAGKRLSP